MSLHEAVQGIIDDLEADLQEASTTESGNRETILLACLISTKRSLTAALKSNPSQMLAPPIIDGKVSMTPQEQHRMYIDAEKTRIRQERLLLVEDTVPTQSDIELAEAKAIILKAE